MSKSIHALSTNIAQPEELEIIELAIDSNELMSRALNMIVDICCEAESGTEATCTIPTPILIH